MAGKHLSSSRSPWQIARDAARDGAAKWYRHYEALSPTWRRGALPAASSASPHWYSAKYLTISSRFSSPPWFAALRWYPQLAALVGRISFNKLVGQQRARCAFVSGGIVHYATAIHRVLCRVFLALALGREWVWLLCCWQALAWLFTQLGRRIPATRWDDWGVQISYHHARRHPTLGDQTRFPAQIEQLVDGTRSRR